MLQPILQPYGFHPNPQQLPHLVSENELIKTFASLGAIILLFRIGLHSELEKVFNLRNLLIALGGVVVPFVVGFMYAQFFGNNFASSLFIGAALTATSVGITVAVLDEMGLLQKQFSQAILGAAVIDDILALMVLALVRNLPQEISMQALMPFLQILAIAVVFVVSGLSLGRLFTMHFFSYKEEPQLSKRTLSGMLAILFFYAFAAESLGLSAIVGAFLAGLVLSYSPLAPLLNRSLFPLDVLFTPIFFISLGMLVDIWSIPAIFLPVLILTIIAIATKLIGCGAVAKAFGMDMRQSILVGFGMVPRGEIALIIGLLGLSAVDASGQPILTAAQYTLIASMAFLTTAIVPAGLKMLIEWARVEGERQKIS
jgi:Kef-type K+ transport system membrane component KefB